MRRKKQLDRQWPDRRLPGDCSVPLGAFLHAVKGRVPAALKDLRDAVLPKYDVSVHPEQVLVASREFVRGLGVRECRALEGVILPVWGWAEQHRLVERRDPFLGRRPWATRHGFPYYCYHRKLLLVAAETVRAWARSPEKAVAMDWSIREPAPARETPLEASWEEVEFLDFLDEAGLLPGPLVESPSTVPRYTMTGAGWNPLTESRQAARQRMRQEAACRIDAELGEADARLERIGAVRIPAKVQLDHFDWLAWFQLTDTTYADLTEGSGQQNRQTVERGVKKAAKFLVGPWWGHWLRPAPRGRPRRGPCR